MAKIEVKGTTITGNSVGDKDFISDRLRNPDFNYGGFAAIKSPAGLNNDKLSVKEWVDQTNAIGQRLEDKRS